MVVRRPFQGETPAWRKKKVRNLALQKKAQDSDEMPGEENDDGPGTKKKKKSKKVQEKLIENSEAIPVATETNVRFEYDQKGLFKYLIYDGYRPQNLKHTRDYVDFLIKEN